jgi:4-amino-4-deoxychorismate lyase
MKSMYLFFNNTLQTEENLKISLSNRAFNYGDGLFETMMFHQNSILYLQDHYDRLKEGMTALSLEIPDFLKTERIVEIVQALIKENNVKGLARIKILAYRKPGGLLTPESCEADIMITAIQGQPCKEVKTNTFFFEEIKLYPSAISRFKTCNALPYILAAVAGKKINADDMILSDILDHICECINSNIFWIKDHTFYTPSLDTGCIDGIKRKQIIKFLKEHRINCKEGRFSKKDLLSAELVFTCNVTGTSVIQKIEDQSYKTTNELYESLGRQF